MAGMIQERRNRYFIFMGCRSMWFDEYLLALAELTAIKTKDLKI
jgi:hypothetical protein